MLCSKCGNEAAIPLKYNGSFLCRNCFVDFFESRVRKTIRKWNMISVGDRICVGLSGGKDSAALLYFLKKFSKRRKIYLSAMTIDVGIAGYCDATIKNAKKISGELEIDHHIFSFKEEYNFTLDNIVSQFKENACTYCGVLRRSLMNKKAKELNLNKIAIAHNLDDEAQTALMNFVSGDMDRIIRSGGVIKDEKFVLRIKPFTECPEEEDLLYAGMKFPDYNFKNICGYRKNAYRVTFKEILNLLEEKHPGSRFQILRSNEKLRERLLINYAVEKPEHCKICGNVCSGEICKACRIIEDINVQKKEKEKGL